MTFKPGDLVRTSSPFGDIEGIVDSVTDTIVCVRIDSQAEPGCSCEKQDDPPCGSETHGVFVAPIAVRLHADVTLVKESP